jgi:SRSO17 transposase
MAGVEFDWHGELERWLASWRTVSWRRGTKGRLSARFAAVRVRVADGPTQRIRDMGHQHMPGDARRHR